MRATIRVVGVPTLAKGQFVFHIVRSGAAALIGLPHQRWKSDHGYRLKGAKR